MFIIFFYAQNNIMKTIRYIITILIIFALISIANLNAISDTLVTKQLVWYFSSFIIYFIISKIPPSYLLRYTIYLYLILNMLLIYLLLFGNSINGSRAWINFGFFSFQPSEFMKITLIILLSILSNHRHFIKLSFLITLIPGILTFLEPDTGNVLFYLIIFLSIVYYNMNNPRKLYIIISILVFALSLFFGLYILNSKLFVEIFGTSFFYRMDRLIAFKNNTSYQLNNALIRIGTSGLYGGYSNIHVPEITTDFMFTLLVSNSGLIGSVLFLFLSLIFKYQFIKIYKESSILNKNIIFAFLTMYIFQESIHELMNTGLFPITGIPLPFISYGGSSLLSYFIIIGVISSIYKGHNKDHSMG